MNETQIPINYKILLAEDDHDMRRFLGQGAAGMRAMTFASFDNGLSPSQIAREPFELLLTDIVMPEWTGSNWPQGDRARPDIKVMFITGFGRGRAETR